MPSGRKKRLAARRRSIGARTSIDKESVSGSHSHASDEGTSPKASDDVNSRLSLATGDIERPTDQTFHTEEWVRVSDFDVGTPTSTRDHDKIENWETVSRENAGNPSSAEDVGEADKLDSASSGSGQNQGRKLPLGDELISESSDKEYDVKSVSSRNIGGVSLRSCSSSSSNISRSTVYSSEAFPKKSDDEERLSNVVLVPSYGEHEDGSQESSFAEVASVEARDDDYHGSIANMASLEERGAENQASIAIKPASLDEQEEYNYESFSGVEDQFNVIEPASSEDQEEEEKHRLSTESLNVKDLQQGEYSSDAISLPSGHESLSNFISNRTYESAIAKSEDRHSSEADGAEIEAPKAWHQAAGQLEKEDYQVPEAVESEPEVSELKDLEQQVIGVATPEIFPSEQNREEGETTVDEFPQGIELTTSDKTSDKSFSEFPYGLVRSISEEEMLEDKQVPPASVSEKEQAPPVNPSERKQIDSAESSPQAEDVDENIAKEVHDAPCSSHKPEPESHELSQLLEIAHSKEIADLGKQEEELLVQEEEELGKGLGEIQPLVEVFSATCDSKPLEGGEWKDFEAVVAEEAPLVKDSPCPVDSGLHIEAELKDRVPALFTKELGEELLGGSKVGFEDEHQITEASVTGDTSSADLSTLQAEEPLTCVVAGKEQTFVEGKSGEDSSLPVDDARNLNGVEFPTDNEEGILVPRVSITESEVPKSWAKSTQDVEASSVVENVDRIGKSARSSEKPEQIAMTSPLRREEKGRPGHASSNLGGCCEPMQWLFANLTRWVNPPAVRN